MFQKKVLVLASLMAVAAVAQAQVKVYGYVEMDVGSYKPAGTALVPATKSTTQVSSGNMMTSFIGFAGSEDLGGGLKAEFTLETFIAPDTGGTLNNNANQFWGRGSNVALSGGFGKVALGQYDTPLFIAGLSYNPFGSSMLFSPTMRHFYDLGPTRRSTTTVGQAALTTDTGWVNSVTYETPDMGGFMATLQWSPKESTAVGTKDSFTVGASYNAGPLSVMAVYADHGKDGGTGAYTNKQKVTSLNGSYDFGVAKGFVQFTDIDNAATTVDSKAYQVGASVPTSAAGKVLVSYGELKTDTTPTTTTKSKITSLAYDHSLSKRTGVFVGYTNEKITGVDKGKSFAAGVRHSF